MKASYRKIFSSHIFSATLWVFLGTGFLNFGNYLYHLLMGRMLGVSLYGALESVISLLYLLFVPTLALSFVIVKFVSSYKGKGDNASISNLYDFLLSKIFIYGIIAFLLIVLLSPLLKKFLHLPSTFLVLVLSVTFLINLFYILNKSVLQGASFFLKFSTLNFVETAIKLLLGVVLVYLGLRVDGAFMAIGIGLLFAFVMSHFFVKKFVKVKLSYKSDFPHKKDLIKFALPTFIATLALTSIFTTDVILVRHFLNNVESGYYSALSVLGKVIYFACSPIVLIIFPMVSETHARGESYTKFINWGMLATIIICLIVTLVYSFQGNLMVNLLFGAKYLGISKYLGQFAMFISLYTVCALLVSFYLSIHRVRMSLFVVMAAVAQIIGIYFFHKDITQVIAVSTVITFVLLISLLLYYPRARATKN